MSGAGASVLDARPRPAAADAGDDSPVGGAAAAATPGAPGQVEGQVEGAASVGRGRGRSLKRKPTPRSGGSQQAHKRASAKRKAKRAAVTPAFISKEELKARIAELEQATDPNVQQLVNENVALQDDIEQLKRELEPHRLHRQAVRDEERAAAQLKVDASARTARHAEQQLQQAAARIRVLERERDAALKRAENAAAELREAHIAIGRIGVIEQRRGRREWRRERVANLLMRRLKEMLGDEYEPFMFRKVCTNAGMLTRFMKVPRVKKFVQTYANVMMKRRGRTMAMRRVRYIDLLRSGRTSRRENDRAYKDTEKGRKQQLGLFDIDCERRHQSRYANAAAHSDIVESWADDLVRYGITDITLL